MPSDTTGTAGPTDAAGVTEAPEAADVPGAAEPAEPAEAVDTDNIQEGDYVVFHGAGAYSVVTNTRFNGFGELRQLTVMGFD